MEKVVSENIERLRELTDKISQNSPEGEYEIVLKKLKKIINEGRGEVTTSATPQTKIKCYEKMCSNITSILNNITF